MDYIEFCKTYFMTTNIPVSLMKNTEPVYSSISDMAALPLVHSGLIAPIERNPDFCRYSPDIEYGRIYIEGTDYSVFLGPIFGVPVNEEITRSYMRENAISLEHREAVAEFLSTIPQISHLQFARHLSVVHMALNGKAMDLEEFYDTTNTPLYTQREQQHIKQLMENQENLSRHNTYAFEQELYRHIQTGDVKKLKEFLASSGYDKSERKLASTPLRQAKNLFILTISKIGIMGAIPGGVDIEKTYQLVEMYIQECEQLQTIDSINALTYAMVIDFCEKAGETRIPDGLSSEVYDCMNYIRSHVNEPINIEDVARQIHRSSSYVAKRFKEELGVNVGAYITRCKLEEAKSLLRVSTLSLSEISNYLCFSTQSYFQNLFKKKFGVTPTQYRKEAQKIQR